MANADRVVIDGTSYGVGNVASVNGQTGEVVLTASDVNAVSSVNGKTGVVVIPTATTSQGGLMSATDKTKLGTVSDEVDAALYNFATTYDLLPWPVSAGKLVLRNNYLYMAKQDIPTQEAWTSSHWRAIDVNDIKALLDADIADTHALALAAYPTPTISGAVASIPDGADGLPVKALVVDIASAAGVTGAAIKRFGKNLLEPFSGKNSYTRGTTVEIQTDGTMRAQGTATAAGWLAPIKTVSLESCGFSVGDTLTISCGANAALVVRFMDSGGSRIRQTATATYGSPVTDTIPAGTVSLTYVYQFGSAQVAVGDVVDITTWFQIEHGSAFTGFAAYQSDAYEVAFPSGAGTVTTGTLDVTGGVLTVGGNTYDVTPLEIDTLLGGNTIFADCGDVTVTYRADPTLYGTSGQTEDDMTANTPIASGKYFQIGNTLYRATAAIATGETIAPGTNCAVTNIAEALNLLNA